LRFAVFVRDGFRCRYCGIGACDGAVLHADHVIPASRGGPTNIDNLVTACLDCNLGKSDKLIQAAPPQRD
jgi:5-methylcytosine-specific restriction endonuclease McrA